MPWSAGAIASFRWTCTCPAARRRPKRSCTASSSCKRRSSARARLLVEKGGSPRMKNVEALAAQIEALAAKIDAHLSGRVQRAPSLKDELAYEVKAADLLSVCKSLRDEADLKFEILIDVSGLDYLVFGR